MGSFIPLGQSDFDSLRMSDSIYVDKTKMLVELASQPGAKIFLARPRRFGKSLLVSTFEALFRHRMNLFEGLAAGGLWKEEKSYPVLRIDFSRIKAVDSKAELLSALDDLLEECSALAGLGYEAVGKPFLSFGMMLGKIREEGRQLVLLIDEYDSPITTYLNKPQLCEKIQDVLSGFYSVVKSYDGVFRFIFITGITRFSHTSIFSAFNNLNDISFRSEYSTLLGYTEQEIINCFREYLDRSATCLGLSEKELVGGLREHYDGYCFDRRMKTHVYTPWSVLKFFENPKDGFLNYWYESGGRPAVLLNLLKKGAISLPDAYSADRSVPWDVLTRAQSFECIDPIALLAQAGYLTMKGCDPQGNVVLGYPNLEVSQSVAYLYADEITDGNRSRATAGVNVREVLTRQDPQALLTLFNHLFNAIDYERYPVRDEASCRAFLQVLMLGANLKPGAEVRSALGRSDLEVEVGPIHWVFEFKFARKGEDEARLLAAGLQQIKARRYGEVLHGKLLKRLALVFSEEKRRFTVWKEAD